MRQSASDQTAAPTDASEENQDQALVAVPLARVVPQAKTARSFDLIQVIVLSLMVLLLGWIGWSWWNSRGLTITIEFEHPHGLQTGAALSLNGVQVGTVEDIGLLPNHKVSIRARLSAAPDVNAMIARQDTQFWIPRFSADLARGLRNVEAMFASHIAIRPGTGGRRSSFIGLEQEPPDVWLREGELPVVLRADRNRGVTEGSSVFYRGLAIGEIVRTQLSRDSRKFEVWLRIFADYRPLVRKNSHFVDSSGLNIGFNLLDGMSVDMDSVQSLIGGSVQLFTPNQPGPPAEAGREFVLELEADEDYASWAPNIEFKGYQSMVESPTADGQTPIGTPATLSWTFDRLLGGSGEGSRQGLVLLTTAGILAPINLLQPDHKAAQQITLNVSGRTLALTADTLTWQEGGIGLCPADGLDNTWPAQRARHAAEPESCRVYGPGAAHKVLNKEYFVPNDGAWDIAQTDDFHGGWNGAAVIANRDGRLIGLLSIDDNAARVHPIHPQAPFLAK